MAAPRNNLEALRAKLNTAGPSSGPAASAAQAPKASKFKPAGRAQTGTSYTAVTSAAKAAPPHPAPSFSLVPHAAQLDSEPVPTRKAHKRPSLDGHAPMGDKPSPTKRARVAPAEPPSRLATPMSDEPAYGQPLTPKSPRKAARAHAQPAAATALQPLQAGANAGNLHSLSTPQLYSRLVSGLTTELEQTRALAQGGDPVMVQQLIQVCGNRNGEVRAEIQRREQAGEQRPLFQGNAADVTQMSLDHLRVMLVTNLDTELEQTRRLLQPDVDIVFVQMFIDIAKKRNSEIIAEISRRDLSAPQPIASSTLGRLAPPVRSHSVPQATFAAIAPSADSYTSKEIIDIDDSDEMDVESIQNVIDVETTTITRVKAVPAPARPPPPPRPASPDLDAAARKSSYTAECQKVLKRTFGLDKFRKHQLCAVTATLEGKDVFVLMPTGGGKSLCYQLPAVISHARNGGMTVVISPLVALMTDQVNHLHAKGVDAFAFSSAADSGEQQDMMGRLRQGNDLPTVVYVTPEKLQANIGFQNVLKKLNDRGKLARFVIDEAHCFSTWGRDFRDSYLALSSLRNDYPGAPLMALTATANKNSVDDIITQLNMQPCVQLTQSFNRPNLRYAIMRKGGTKKAAFESVYDVIRKHAGETGIVYCFSKKDCEEVALELREKYRVQARHFHADLVTEDKTKVQQAWQSGECKVIVATIAFGMGIDKANVRFVVHHSLPKSLEGYYQETGRAGRDGNESECVLLYSQKDFQRLKDMIWKDQRDKSGKVLTMADKQRLESDLKTVMRFCLNDVDCRRSQVLQYFGEAFDRSACNGFCDNCVDALVTVRENQDYTPAAQDALRLVQEMQQQSEQITQVQCVAAYWGSQTKDVKDRGHDKLQHFAKGQNMSRVQAERLFDYLLLDGALEAFVVRNGPKWSNSYVKMGNNRAVQNILSGRQKFVMSVKTGSTVSVQINNGKATKAKGKTRAKATTMVKTRAPRHQEDIYSDDEGDNAYVLEDNGGSASTSIVVEDDDPIEIGDDWDPEIEDFGFDYDDDFIEMLDPFPQGETAAATTTVLDAKKVQMDKHQRLYQELRVKRREIAKEHRKAEDHIMPDHVLESLAATMPTDMIKFKRYIKDSLDGDELEAQRIGDICGPMLSVIIGTNIRSPPASAAPAMAVRPAPAAPSSSAIAPVRLDADKISKFKFKRPQN